MVRITNGEVSVRVGGGWESLEEFLDRHDPNRCKFHDSIRESTRRELMHANSLKQKMQPETVRPRTAQKKLLNRRKSSQLTHLGEPQRSMTHRRSLSPVGDGVRGRKGRRHPSVSVRIIIYHKIYRTATYYICTA